jgi:uncharacterized surface protein with fasciclin (FAS1) repeats
MKTHKIYLIMALVLTAIGVTSCRKTSFVDSPSQVSIYQMITDDYQFSMIRYVIDRAGLTEQLKSGDLTLIAPTNTAFAEMGFGSNTNATLEKLSTAQLTDLAKNHLLSGKFDIAMVPAGSKDVQTQGKLVKITHKDNDYYVDGGDITHLQVVATNGYLYVINRVILPPSFLGADILQTLLNRVVPTTFTSFQAAVIKASTGSTNYVALLAGAIPYTLFVPDNNAFIRGGYANAAAVTAASVTDLDDLLKRHIIVGTKLTSDFDSVAVTNYSGTASYFDREKVRITAGVVTTNNWVNGVPFNGRGASSNGIHTTGSVYHVVSQFLPKPATTTTLAQIQGNLNLTFFAAAIDEASKKTGTTVDFNALLSGSRSYTVYAPTDAAFQAAGYATPAAVRALTISNLTNLVKYHIINRRRASWGIGNNSVQTILAMNNASNVLTTRSIAAVVSATAYTVLGDGNSGLAATVTTADVPTTNGMLNIINKILVP